MEFFVVAEFETMPIAKWWWTLKTCLNYNLSIIRALALDLSTPFWHNSENQVRDSAGRGLHISAFPFNHFSNRELRFVSEHHTHLLQLLLVAWTADHTNAMPLQSPCLGLPCYLGATWALYECRQQSSVAWHADFIRLAATTFCTPTKN